MTPAQTKVVTEDFPYQRDSTALFAALRNLPEAIWLDSGKPRSLQGRFDIISAAPDALLETRGSVTTLYEQGEQIRLSGDPFALARDLLKPLLTDDSQLNNTPFCGGLMGYFGYALNSPLAGINQPNSDPVQLPDMRLGRYLWALVVNHQSGHSQLHFHPRIAADLKAEVRARLAAAVGSSPAVSRFALRAPFSATTNIADYQAAIARIHRYIRAGDCYQVNYAQHFSAPYSGDLFSAYCALRSALASPYSGFWQWGQNGDQALLSLSPERFLKQSVGMVETKPIKGTIARGNTLEQDQENAIQLINSSKDRAENLMIVDLLRNDLGKSCVPGSIRVPKLFGLESFANVHHLVSTVTGELAAGEDALSLLANCFPGGSITGAPKKRAMEIIAELEPVQRSLYCGSLGYISATGRMDSNIAIRTLVASNQTLHCWGGGGIVADSDAEAEYGESLAKIGKLLRTLEGLN